MNLISRRGLPTLLGIALTTAAAVAVASPARADTPPTATYTLDSRSIWSGQLVRLAESGLTGSNSVTRTIDWGDGSRTQATAATVWSHTYASTGSYPVTVTLDDGTQSGPGTLPAGGTVTVGTAPGTYGWKKSTLYTYPGYQEQATMVASGIPANATEVWTAWGDGETTLLGGSSTATAPHWFPTGTWAPQVTLENAQGAANPRTTSTLTVRPDTTRPSVRVTVPSKPTKASSWSTIKGTSTDSQSGADLVGVLLWRWNSSADWLYDFGTRKWIKYTGQKNLPTTVWANLPVDSAGNWHVATSGLAKGYHMEVDFFAMDRAGNETDTYYLTYNLTS